MGNIKLRKARKSDMPLIKEHIERFRLDDENINYDQFIVAEGNKKVVGFGRIKPYKSCFELGCLGVLESYRNHEIGAAIVERLIKDFPSDDVWITTDIPKYFERLGFQRTDQAPEEIKDKIKGVCQEKKHPDAVIMLLNRGRLKNHER